MQFLDSTKLIVIAIVAAAIWGCARVESVETAGSPGDASNPPQAEPLRTAVSTPAEQPVRLAKKPPTVARGPESRGNAGEAGDWTLAVDRNGGVGIRYKGAPIVRTLYQFWGPNWTWGGPKFQAGPMNNDRAAVSGEVKKLGATITGGLRVIDSRTLRYDLEMTTDQAFPSAVGGGIQWSLKLDSPAFQANSKDPELLEGNTGWVWQVGPDPEQSMTVRFDPPIAKVYFERNQKNTIRTFFLADRISIGRRPVGFTVTLPKGGVIIPSDADRYGPEDTASWFDGALQWDSFPVDLSYLNKDDRPAGRRGPVKADGDRLVFADGTTARFWGANLVGYALFKTPRSNVPEQARRMARLGYNLMRIHHHDSAWVRPNVFDPAQKDTVHLRSESLDSLDYWIKCMKDEGIYVWLDLHVGRSILENDPISQGVEEIRKNKSELKGFNYFNPDVVALMRRFQRQYLDRVNPYTRTAYKDDPAIVGLLITNENDLTQHFGNQMLPVKGNKFHSDRFLHDADVFAEETGLSSKLLGQTWLPGPSKILLNHLEHRFNRLMIDDVRRMGFHTPIATTSYWGNMWLTSLPSLTEGDVIDVHSYGQSEALSVNPRYEANFIPWIGAAQVAGKPLTISEWNVEFPKTDRFTAPLYVASIASLQGWDAPMLYTHSQDALTNSKATGVWSTHMDPAIAGIMPAAAVAFRRGHVSPARDEYCLNLDRPTLFGRKLSPDTSAAIRTLVEQNKLTIGLPKMKELPWFTGSAPAPNARVLTDPDRDLIPNGQDFVKSDTGELVRDWKAGVQTIDTPKTQAVSGWIGATTHELSSAVVEVKSPRKAVVALTSIDDQPLSKSNFILITAVARTQLTQTGGRAVLPFRSEPVVATIRLKTANRDLQLLTLGPSSRVVRRADAVQETGGVRVTIPTTHGTHWYVLQGKSGGTPPQADDSAAPKGR